MPATSDHRPATTRSPIRSLSLSHGSHSLTFCRSRHMLSLYLLSSTLLLIAARLPASRHSEHPPHPHCAALILHTNLHPCSTVGSMGCDWCSAQLDTFTLQQVTTSGSCMPPRGRQRVPPTCATPLLSNACSLDPSLRRRRTTFPCSRKPCFQANPHRRRRPHPAKFRLRRAREAS